MWEEREGGERKERMGRDGRGEEWKGGMEGRKGGRKGEEEGGGGGGGGEGE